MALYYPPKQGLKGWRSEHWGGGVIPDSLANAIASAQLVSKEAIYDSNTEWLILDSKGNTPSKINIDLQPPEQIKRANYYGLIVAPPQFVDDESQRRYITTPAQPTPLPPPRIQSRPMPTTIRITESAGAYSPVQYLQQNWLSKNWQWLLPLGIGFVILAIPNRRDNNG